MLKLVPVATSVLAFALAASGQDLSTREQGLLRMIEQMNRANFQLIQSIEFRYDSIRQASGQAAAQTGPTIKNSGYYAGEGSDRVYQYEALEQGASLLFVQNGSRLESASAQHGSDGRTILIGSEGRADIRRASPELWERVDGGLARRITAIDPQADGKIVVVQPVQHDGQNLIQVVLEKEEAAPGGGRDTMRMTVLYDANKRYLPVRSEFRSTQQTDGEPAISGTSEVLGYETYDVGGETLYLPTGVRELVRGANLGSRQTLVTLNRESVRINQPLPVDLFKIEKRPGDQVINRDIDVEVASPSGAAWLMPDVSAQPASQTSSTISPRSQAPPDAKFLQACEGVRIVLIPVPAGRTLIGSPDDEVGLTKYLAEIKRRRGEPTRPKDEGPPHQVTFAHGFSMSKYEITNKQFRCFQPQHRVPPTGGLSGKPHDENGDDLPADVSWNEAVAFCDWLSDTTGAKVRLPTEEEWEYACRAGSLMRFPWGDAQNLIHRYANVADEAHARVMPEGGSYFEGVDDGQPFAAPVGTYAPNGFGLHDMIGNREEWCADLYRENAYTSAPGDDDADHTRVVRGGSYNSDIVSARSAARRGGEVNRRTGVGFRIVVDHARSAVTPVE